MDERDAVFPIADPAATAAVAMPPPVLPRWLAVLQVLLVCGVPTQIVAAAVLLLAFGMRPVDANGLTFAFVATSSLLDTGIVIVLIRLFLSTGGERPVDVFVGRRPPLGEVWRGVAWLPAVFLLVTGLVLAIRAAAPWMHNVERSPFEAFVGSPLDTAIFLVVVVVAGGVREELQRAFILHRFEQRLGGARVGLVLFSLAFGAFHVTQGYDVAVATACLGLFWGVMYLRRQSAILPMANHAAFNATQVLQIVVARSVGA